MDAAFDPLRGTQERREQFTRLIRAAQTPQARSFRHLPGRFFRTWIRGTARHSEEAVELGGYVQCHGAGCCVDLGTSHVCLPIFRGLRAQPALAGGAGVHGRAGGAGHVGAGGVPEALLELLGVPGALADGDGCFPLDAPADMLATGGIRCPTQQLHSALSVQSCNLSQSLHSSDALLAMMCICGARTVSQASTAGLASIWLKIRVALGPQARWRPCGCGCGCSSRPCARSSPVATRRRSTSPPTPV